MGSGTLGDGDLKGWGHERPLRFMGTPMETWNICGMGDTGTPRVVDVGTTGIGDMGTLRAGDMGTPLGLGTGGPSGLGMWGPLGHGTLGPSEWGHGVL